MSISLAPLKNRYTVFFIDMLMIFFAWFGAYWLRFNLSPIPAPILESAFYLLPCIFFIQSCAYMLFGLYRGDWRYASMPDLQRIIGAVITGCACLFIGLLATRGIDDVPRSVFPLYSLLLIAFLGGARFFYRGLKETRYFQSTGMRVLIIGAGTAGESLARNLLRDHELQYRPIVFVDDGKKKIGCDIHGIPVVAKCKHIPKIIKKYKIDLSIIAIPSLHSSGMRKIVELCEISKVPFRTLPSVTDLAAGKVTVNALRPVSLEDLLGRDPVSLSWEQISKAIAGQTVLITGAGGSIGSEICRQVAKLNPEQLIVVENNEYNLYSLQMELTDNYPNLNLVSHLLDVTEVGAVNNVMQTHKPHLVFHAAAFKHVPLLQNQVRMALKNNIIGTKVVAQAALQANVTQFIFISTDKVVHPTNVMGASKRVAELFCQNLNKFSKTQFITVRFGNVLGSTGSVIPLFQKQLAAGGPITVTHPEVTRYFMTIPEAAQLILQATVIGSGGEIFVLDMGEPIKIRYLAEQMIQLAGKDIGHDVEIEYIGLRPGEKLHEALFYEHETLLNTEHKKILKAHHQEVDWDSFMREINRIDQACQEYNEAELLQSLKVLIPKFETMPTQQPETTVES